MGFIKNTLNIVKNDPKILAMIAGNITNAYFEISEAKESGMKWSNAFGLVTSALSVGKGLSDVVGQIRDSERYRMFVSPTSDPILGSAILEWFEDNEVEAKTYDARVVSAYGETSVQLIPDSQNDVVIDVDGYPITVTSDRIAITKGGQPTGEFHTTFEISSETKEGFEAFINLVTSNVIEEASDTERPVRLFTQAEYSYDGFNRSTLRKRAVQSVILKNNGTDTIIKHVENFRNNRELYEAKGYPYHTGIMLHGPAGTGKTSISTAMANHFKMDVYQIALSGVTSDTQLFELVSNIPEDSIILFEDIDVATKSSHDRKEVNKDNPGVTLSGLLNVLDGNLTPHGAVFVLTTNDKDSLDSALVRPGRVDLSIEVDYADSHQVKELAEYYIGFVPAGIPDFTSKSMISPSDIINIFRSNLHDNAKAGLEIVEFLNKKVGENLNADFGDLSRL